MWGLTVEELHARFWQSRGLVVVMRGDPVPAREAEWYLLVDRDVLLLADLTESLSRMYWSGREMLILRLVRRAGDEEEGTRHRVVGRDGAIRFEPWVSGRSGGAGRARRAILTHVRAVAEGWRGAGSVAEGMSLAMSEVPEDRRGCWKVAAAEFDVGVEEEAARFTRELVRTWRKPVPAIAGVRPAGHEVWADEDAVVSEDARLLGPVWVGAGRRLNEGEVLGPAVLWDTVERTVEAEEGGANDDEIYEREIADRAARRVRVHVERVSRWSWAAKRVLDVVGALVGLALTLPMYPLLFLAIWIEDGSPFFFGHKRETLGGREFKCWKFRSMRRDAEAIRKQLKNEADGPQFFMREDPRMTRVGRILRATNLDEVPQFWNVLMGEMSLVGPRPSPRAENLHCPAWRQARLSVRPGITGLWQVERTRAPGMDFQEWVKFDLEYVQRMSLMTDVWIMARTVVKVLKGGGGGK